MMADPIRMTGVEDGPGSPSTGLLKKVKEEGITLEFSFSHEKDGEVLNQFPPDYNTTEIMIVFPRFRVQFRSIQIQIDREIKLPIKWLF